MKNKLSLFGIVLFAILFGSSCKKNQQYDTVVPDDLSHFTNKTGGIYQILTPTSTFKIPVGVTKASDLDRTVTISVSSPTGAQLNTHFTLDKSEVTIRAGQVLDTITVQGNFPLYDGTGRKDTLIFTLTVPGIPASSYNSTYKLFMRGPCFNGDVDAAALNSLLGIFNNTNETLGTSAYGPYRTTVSNVTVTSPTTARITVLNIWDNGWGPIQFDLNWTDPINRTVRVVPQDAIAGSNAGDLNPAYAGQTVAVREFSGQTGNFFVCSNAIDLKMQLGVTGLGFFNVLYSVNMRR